MRRRLHLLRPLVLRTSHLASPVAVSTASPSTAVALVTQLTKTQTRHFETKDMKKDSGSEGSPHLHERRVGHGDLLHPVGVPRRQGHRDVPRRRTHPELRTIHQLSCWRTENEQPPGRDLVTSEDPVPHSSMQTNSLQSHWDTTWSRTEDRVDYRAGARRGSPRQAGSATGNKSKGKCWKVWHECKI